MSGRVNTILNIFINVRRVNALFINLAAVIIIICSNSNNYNTWAMSIFLAFVGKIQSLGLRQEYIIINTNYLWSIFKTIFKPCLSSLSRNWRLFRILFPQFQLIRYHTFQNISPVYLYWSTNFVSSFFVGGSRLRTYYIHIYISTVQSLTISTTIWKTIYIHLIRQFLMYWSSFNLKLTSNLKVYKPPHIIRKP